MISYHNGDLLKSGCDIIAHQVNLQGVMGGGLALQIAEKYPQCEKNYMEYVKKWSKKVDLIGCINSYSHDKSPIIVNCFSQEQDYTTNYEAVRNCFKQVRIICNLVNKKTIGVAFNYGCGIAKGDWNKVLAIFKELFAESNIELQIWKLGE